MHCCVVRFGSVMSVFYRRPAPMAFFVVNTPKRNYTWRGIIRANDNLRSYFCNWSTYEHHFPVWQYKPNTRQFMCHSASCVPTRPTLDLTNVSPKQNKQESEEVEMAKQKVLYNTVLQANKLSWAKMKQLESKEKRLKKTKSKTNKSDLPISLKYILDCDTYNIENNDDTHIKDNTSSSIVHLPYSVHGEVNFVRDDCKSDNEGEQECAQTCKETEDGCLERKPSKQPIRTKNDVKLNSRTKYNWMLDYELYPDTEEDLAELEVDDGEPWKSNYGTPNTKIPISQVPCGGCGALLHCQDTAIPGYLPSELFEKKTDAQLRTVKCQRCHFLLHYNTALAVNVSPEDYPKILSQMKTKKALAILIVDLMDFPCSIWPNILDIIGTKRPVVVVGNKIDLFPQDCPGFLDRIKTVLVQALEDSGMTAANIKHVALISAKTGYGVDSLITKLHTFWEYKGDIYLLGCTNAGKSTLFNALLQSDLCKERAVDLMQRATTSPWPGTTLNLLKFPMLRPEGWRVYLRAQRLVAERKALSEENRLRQLRARDNRTAATLMGRVGRTFRPAERELVDPFSVGTSARPPPVTVGTGLDTGDREFGNSRWCFDTPGTVQPSQLINLLTTEELMLALPRTLLHPRTFSVTPGCSLFVAGLARLDYVAGPRAVRFTVFASPPLPLTACRTADADALYPSLLGTEYLAVPTGGADRLARWPGLGPGGAALRLTGEDWARSCADVVLSSAGWVAVTPGPGMEVELRAWTPGGRGVFVRPSVLPHAVNHRGARILGTPAYRKGPGIYRKP